MHFTEGRIKRIANDIRKLIYNKSYNIENIQIRYGRMPEVSDINSVVDGWQDYIPGTPWCSSSDDIYALFKAKVIVPEDFEGDQLVLSIKTNRTGWNAINPQMLLYVNGKEFHGLDTNHTEVLIDSSAKNGTTFDIMIYAFSGLTRNHHTDELREESEVRLLMQLKALDPLIEEFDYNLMIPSLLLEQLPKDSTEHVNLINILNDTVNMVDLRIPYSQEFFASIKEADNYLNEKLYSKEQGFDAVVTCIGHTHIDVAWLWRYCHTREKAARSFSTVLRLMDQYPEFVFMSSQPQLYEFVKEDYPAIYERIKERVKEGRWEPEGGMWVEPDTNLPSGESLVRQLLFGKRFFEKEFGVENKILWLPDVFGYNGNLPQIMKKSGVEYFMTAKLEYNEFNRFPLQTFLWKGIDGSEVLTHLIMNHKSCYNAQADAEDIVQGWNNYCQKDINNDILMSFGFGDGGGGPTKHMLESIRRYKKGLPGSPKVRIGSVKAFFDGLEKRVRSNDKLPKWDGELYFEWHRGTYTSMARNKKYNRKAEFLYTSAEWISSFNTLLSGSSYPAKEMNSGWKSILLNQFHDVLPGSSIKQVYEDTDKIYEEVFKTGSQVLNTGFEQITASVRTEGSSVVVFNQLSWERDGFVEFEYQSEKSLLYLEGNHGKRYICHKSNGSDTKFTAYVEDIPPKGYTTFKILDAGDNIEDTEEIICISKTVLENMFYKINIDENGHFTSIFDKRTKREILKAGERGNVLQAFEDKPMKDPYWGSDADNWNLDIFYSEKMWKIDDVESMQVLEAGSQRGVLRIIRRFLNSRITQDIILYGDIARIDFKTVIDWKEKDIVLKACFPVDINSNRAAYEIQYGYVERDTHWNTSWDYAKFEVCAHKWADLSEDGYGVSLLNDCKYGHDIKEGRMRLTLLRSGTTPNPDADRELHEFTYSLYPHTGGWREGRTLQEAYELNCPLHVKTAGKQEGCLPDSMSMLSLDKENVIAEVVKKAEDSDDLIIRIYEAYNRRCNARIKLFREIKEILECDLMEKALGQPSDPVMHDGNEFEFLIKPFEIKTFKIAF